MALRYEITVAGDVGPMVLAALETFELQPGPSGSSCLLGDVADQSALQGALHRLDDLHVELLEVRRVEG